MSFARKTVVLDTSSLIPACLNPQREPFFLALAIAAQADVLVSSDIHLIEMHPYQGIPILRLSDFKARMLSE